MMKNKHIIHTDKFPTLAYRKEGSGPVMVLIHGFPLNSGLWDKVWQGLSENFTVIMPDLPGVGDSVFVEASMEELAESVKLILDAEKIDTAVLSGHSMGGYVALAFTEMYKSVVAGLSLVHSTAAADDDAKKETRIKSIELIQKGGKEAFIKQMIPNLFSDSFKKDNKDIIQQYIQESLVVSADALVSFYNAMIKRADRIRILEETEAPVQFIMGKEDVVIPADKVLSQSKIARVNFISLYSDCGHMSMIEQPENLMKDLTDFGRYCFANR